MSDKSLRGKEYWAYIFGVVSIEITLCNYLIFNKFILLDADKIAPQGVLLLGGAISAYIIPRAIKEKLIFLKFQYELPSYSIFSRIDEDHRVNKANIEKKIGTLPVNPIEQTRTWYKLYSEIQLAPKIFETHLRYLVFRDCFGATLFLYPVSTLVLLKIYNVPFDQMLKLTLVNFFLLIALGFIANASGKRFASNVLAEHS